MNTILRRGYIYSSIFAVGIAAIIATFQCSWGAEAAGAKAQASGKAALTLEERVDRVKAAREVQNLMSRYTYYQSAFQQPETVALFASKTPGTKVEMMWGVYEGIEGVKKCFLKDHYQRGDKALVGAMHMDTLTTPIIIVAGDGKTAKGVWISPGFDTMVTNGKAQANWAYYKFGTDFVKEGGVWKIWHLHIYGVLYTDYNKSWAEPSKITWSGPNGQKLNNDKPPTTQWWYTPDTTSPQDQPKLPEDYNTFGETFSY
jgi:hypothetical protein